MNKVNTLEGGMSVRMFYPANHFVWWYTLKVDKTSFRFISASRDQFFARSSNGT